MRTMEKEYATTTNVVDEDVDGDGDLDGDDPLSL